jgi:hypothetical protein
MVNGNPQGRIDRYRAECCFSGDRGRGSEYGRRTVDVGEGTTFHLTYG